MESTAVVILFALCVFLGSEAKRMYNQKEDNEVMYRNKLEKQADEIDVWKARRNHLKAKNKWLVAANCRLIEENCRLIEENAKLKVN